MQIDRKQSTLDMILRDSLGKTHTLLLRVDSKILFEWFVIIYIFEII